MEDDPKNPIFYNKIDIDRLSQLLDKKDSCLPFKYGYVALNRFHKNKFKKVLNEEQVCETFEFKNKKDTYLYQNATMIQCLLCDSEKDRCEENPEREGQYRSKLIDLSDPKVIEAYLKECVAKIYADQYKVRIEEKT
eukprot:UN08750